MACKNLPLLVVPFAGTCLFPSFVGCVYLLKVLVPSETLVDVTVMVVLATFPSPTSDFDNVPQLSDPAVDPAFKTFPLLEVPVAGTCKLPSPVG